MVCAFEVISPDYILAAVRVSDNWDYVLGDYAKESYVEKLRLKSLGAAGTPDPRGRTEEPAPSNSRVRTNHLDLANNPAVLNTIMEAEAGDDPSDIPPVSKHSSVASAPVAAFGEESTENPMFKDKALKVLEAALQQPLEDLAEPNGDPLDIQRKMVEKANQNTEEINKAKQAKSFQFAEETVAQPKGVKSARTEKKPSQSASSSTGAVTVDLESTSDEEDDPHLNPPPQGPQQPTRLPVPERWRPTLRRDGYQPRVVLSLGHTGRSARADSSGPKGSIAHELPGKNKKAEEKKS